MSKNLRPGSLQAKELYASSNLEDWMLYLNSYDAAMALTDEKKKKGGALVKLDNFVHTTYPTQALKQGYFELSDLSKVAQWKMTRGKMRPLQKKIDSNNASKVKEASKSALACIQANDWRWAIDAVSGLYAVGVATASALLAPISPEMFPFMDDVVVEAVSVAGERDYTIETYTEIREKLVDKANQLNLIKGKSEIKWNAELVGRALWSRAVMFALGGDQKTKKTSLTHLPAVNEGKDETKEEEKSSKKRKML